MSAPRCEASVHDSLGAGFHRCGNRAKSEEGGKWFCGLHNAKARARYQKRSDDAAAEYRAKVESGIQRDAEIASLRQQLAEAERERDAVLERGELVLVWMARVLQERNELVVENATLRQQLEAVANEAIALIEEGPPHIKLTEAQVLLMNLLESVRGERKPEAQEGEPKP